MPIRTIEPSGFDWMPEIVVGPAKVSPIVDVRGFLVLTVLA
jgi:hypothetical protein